MSTQPQGAALPDNPPSPPTVSLALAVWLAVLLSLGAAISLGITRFAYGLLLPPMRADMGWSYTLAGLMNTFNALGYLLGALCTPWLMRRQGAERVLLWGAFWATVFMAGSGFFASPVPLLAQRLLAGVASAWVFIAGGVLAARWGASRPGHSGLLLGLYYGGTGLGIVASAVSVPWVLEQAATQAHSWTWAWWWLAGLCALATLGLSRGVRAMHVHGLAPSHPVAAARTPGHAALPLRRLVFALLGYSLFGVGYIGYITFVIALLREQGVSTGAIAWFYSLLGVATVLAPRVWAGLLDRHRDGQALARLNALLGVATLLPAVTTAWPVVLLSGVLFGGVFLSVVASTTALVRHNLPQSQWAGGISAFTIVFALGQIVGPTVVGSIADGPGGLARGLVFSAVALWLGAVLAWCQKALH